MFTFWNKFMIYIAEEQVPFSGSLGLSKGAPTVIVITKTWIFFNFFSSLQIFVKYFCFFLFF